MKKITLISSIILIFSYISFAQTDIPVISIKQLETDCSNNDYLACYFAGQLFQDTGLMISATTAYKKACDKIAAVREKMQESLKTINGIKVYLSQANYILCKIEKSDFNIHSVMTYLLSKNLLIKDCSSKKGYSSVLDD